MAVCPTVEHHQADAIAEARSLVVLFSLARTALQFRLPGLCIANPLDFPGQLVQHLAIYRRVSGADLVHLQFDSPRVGGLHSVLYLRNWFLGVPIQTRLDRTAASATL